MGIEIGARRGTCPSWPAPARALNSHALEWVSDAGPGAHRGCVVWALAGGSGGSARLAAAAVAVAVCMSMLSGAAGAGDFYLRGGIGLDRPTDTVFTDRDCSSSAPAALHGCGTGGDGAPYRSRGGFGTAPALELGLGYAGGAARFEVLVEYRPRFAFEGRANFLAPERRQSVAADLSSVSGMVAAYVDLAGLGLPKPGPFAPFVGAGVGAVRSRTGEMRMTFPATTTIVPGASPDRSRLDGDGRGVGRAGRAGDPRSRLALHGLAARSAPDRARVGWSGGTGAGIRCRSISRRRGRGSRATGSGCPCATHSEGAAGPGYGRTAGWKRLSGAGLQTLSVRQPGSRKIACDRARA